MSKDYVEVCECQQCGAGCTPDDTDDEAPGLSAPCNSTATLAQITVRTANKFAGRQSAWACEVLKGPQDGTDPRVWLAGYLSGDKR
jgi:hypothetical protein